MALREFAAAIMQHLEFVVAPILGPFARNADAHGFPAKTESVKDESNNLTYTLKFAVAAGTTLGEHPDNKPACVIKAWSRTAKWSYRPTLINGLAGAKLSKVKSLHCPSLARSCWNGRGESCSFLRLNPA